jgi:hypothetical protein
VALHQHPLNAQRQAAGKPPVNSVWFWGGGVLPDHVTTSHELVQSNEVTLRALAKSAKVDGVDLPRKLGLSGLVDLRAVRDLAELDAQWLQPALQRLRMGGLASLHLDNEDGTQFTLRRNQRWRFWRKPLKAFDA